MWMTLSTALWRASNARWIRARSNSAPTVAPRSPRSPSPSSTISGKPIDIAYDLGKPEGDKGRCADYGKAARELGWAPKVPLRTGLTALYEWMDIHLSRGRSRLYRPEAPLAAASRRPSQADLFV